MAAFGGNHEELTTVREPEGQAKRSKSFKSKSNLSIFSFV